MGPLFSTCAASSAVTALLGSNPVRIYPFGTAPQDVTLPYAVYQTVGGSPENFVTDAPDMDIYTVQVDIYAATGASALAVRNAMRDAIQSKAHIISWRDSYDTATKRYRQSFDVDWFVNR